MAQPTTAKFGKMIISLGDDTEPPVYAAPCGFTTKGVTLSKNLSEVNIPDCDNPDDPIWVGRDVTSQSGTINGDGVAAGESLPDWDEAFMKTESVPMKVEITFDGLGVKTIEGKWHVDSEAITVEAGGRVNLAISAQSDGELLVTWTPDVLMADEARTTRKSAKSKTAEKIAA